MRKYLGAFIFLVYFRSEFASGTQSKTIALWSSNALQTQISEVVGLSLQTLSSIVSKFLQHSTK